MPPSAGSRCIVTTEDGHSLFVFIIFAVTCTSIDHRRDQLTSPLKRRTPLNNRVNNKVSVFAAREYQIEHSSRQEKLNGVFSQPGL
jgi:hypothetical protein